MRSRLTKDYLPIDLEAMRPPGFHTQKYESVRRCCEKVDKGSGWRLIDCCPVCQESERHNLMHKCGIDIVQCKNCLLGYSSKFPVDLADVYSDQSYLDQARNDYEDNILYRMERFAKERTQILVKWLNKKPEDCQLLDVGCGTGWFIEYARQQGFTVSGHEPGARLAAYTAQRLGVKIWTCDLADIVPKPSFDVVTMFDVLEHTPDPLYVMKQIERLLSPGGIALLFVPNLDSIGFSILKEESALVSPAEHLLYFSDASLRSLADKVGFKTLHTETKGMDVFDLLAYYRDKAQSADIVDFLSTHADMFQATIDTAGNANHLRIVLQRQEHD